MNVKKVLYERVVVPTVMYGLELWGMKETERQKLNVFEMKCLRSMAGLSRMDSPFCLTRFEIRTFSFSCEILQSYVCEPSINWHSQIRLLYDTVAVSSVQPFKSVIDL